MWVTSRALWFISPEITSSSSQLVSRRFERFIRLKDRAVGLNRSSHTDEVAFLSERVTSRWLLSSLLLPPPVAGRQIINPS